MSAVERQLLHGHDMCAGRRRPFAYATRPHSPTPQHQGAVAEHSPRYCLALTRHSSAWRIILSRTTALQSNLDLLPEMQTAVLLVQLGPETTCCGATCGSGLQLLLAAGPSWHCCPGHSCHAWLPGARSADRRARRRRSLRPAALRHSRASHGRLTDRSAARASRHRIMEPGSEASTPQNQACHTGIDSEAAPSPAAPTAKEYRRLTRPAVNVRGD